MSVFTFKQFAVYQAPNTFKVGTDALILGSSVHANTYQSILEIGAGSGVISLMVKQNNPDSKILAIDIDKQSVACGKINFKNSPWYADLNYQCIDFNTLTATKQFDCIICNPPFYEDSLLSQSAELNRAKHTQNFSIEKLFEQANNLLNLNGYFWVILPHATSEKWIQFAETIDLYLHSNILVYGKPEKAIRNILQFGKTKHTCSSSNLTIRDKFGNYTEQYKQLTREFHNRDW